MSGTTITAGFTDPDGDVADESDYLFALSDGQDLNPEPFAYESAFSMKWLIEAQVDQQKGKGIHPIAGNLDYNTVAPWLGWGAYLWANGLVPRGDGLV